MRNYGPRLLCLPLLLTGCCGTDQIVRTETVEVNVPAFVALPDALTAPVVEPAAPPRDGFDGEALVDWVERLRAALREANVRLEAIRARQPKGAP